MNTTNFADKNTSVWLLVLYCLALVFSFAFAGCSNEGLLLQTFSRLEKEALKYGTVSVGAARVKEYDCNDPSRKRLKDALKRMQCKWLKDPNDRPQGYWANYASSYFEVMLGFAKSLEKSKQKDPSTYFASLSKAFENMIKTQPPRPSEIELIGFYMAAQKFVESELEELSLGNPTDPNFRRFVVSLDLTAWVRGKARAALVYIDLYPYRADSWCHEAAKILTEEGYENKWKDLMIKELGDGFRSFKPSTIKPPKREELKKKNLEDLVAFCHRWLEKNQLRPRIIQVERMGQGEYLILGEASYSGTEFQVGGAHPSGVSGSLKAGTARKEEGLIAKVRPLSLTFVAGERRAGWLFLPGKTTEGRMPPTERRLRMVVDVPDKMSKLAIHVHKNFLDADLGILSGASFAKQMDNFNITRSKLSETEVCFEEATGTRQYRLVKSRMRNLLRQGWSEETVVDIPAK